MKRTFDRAPHASSTSLKLLIYGHRGWIGQQFVEVCQGWSPRVDFVCGQSRCDNASALREELQRVCPTHVIAFIGRTHGTVSGSTINTIDYLEQPGKLVENVRDNLFAPCVLASLCRESKIHFTYLGTGCIFTYDNEHPLYTSSSPEAQTAGFTEQDLPNFTGSSYSTVKVDSLIK